MSKVLIDRELLERAVSIPTKESLEANQAAIVDRGRAQSDIRELLTRLAEVEAPVQCPASHPAECYAPGTQVVHASLVHGLVRQADEARTSLSAVTAERDRLREALEDLLGCPANVVQATVPKAGIEAAPPYQVVLDVSVSLTRWNKAKAAMAAKDRP